MTITYAGGLSIAENGNTYSKCVSFIFEVNFDEIRASSVIEYL